MVIEPPKYGILCGRFARINFTNENVKIPGGNVYVAL